MNNKLTVIIPFLNEGKEVYNTVKNLRENSEQLFEIILINDCSTDGYDYKKVAEDFDALYIEHSKRMGVAASRDEGVRNCSTDYILFLDAHMRVFQKKWVEIFNKELDKDCACLLCASTLSIDSEGEVIEEKLGYGAYFDFTELSIKWLTHECALPEGRVIDIPCVLGAAYACSKEYWLHLEGLKGLRSYGLDEQLISLKVWLDGGKCRLIKDITFGHIFRGVTQTPYEGRAKDYLKNILFIAELFYNFDMKVELLTKLRELRGANFTSEVMNEFVEEDKEFVLACKERYDALFPNSIDYVVALNSQYANLLQDIKNK